jgi:hypothetical protein
LGFAVWIVGEVYWLVGRVLWPRFGGFEWLKRDSSLRDGITVVTKFEKRMSTEKAVSG